MLDIAFIRENADLMKQVVEAKHVDLSIDELLSVDESRKAVLSSVESMRAARNEISGKMKNIQELSAEEKEALITEGKTIKEQLSIKEEELNALEEQYRTLMLAVPNVYSEDTPVGHTEDDNVIARTVGDKPAFDFEPKEHWELGKTLGVIDTETSATVSGSRFGYLMGDIVRMQFGIIQMAFEFLGDTEALQKLADEKGINVDVTEFTPVIPPVMMRPEVMDRMGRLHPMDERYQTTLDGLMLVGSAEHTLGPIHMDQVFDESELPVRYVGYSTAFRREAGSYGKDMKGIFRMHQFDKIEIETFTTKDKGFAEQDFIVAIQEHLVQKLGLPYQVVLKCTYDQGTPDVRAYDIETWMPGQGKYRETHTSDYMTDFQARRLNTQYRTAEGEKEFVHMNDATVFAIGRILIAIMENYQQADGTIRVPDVLVPYVGKEIIG